MARHLSYINHRGTSKTMAPLKSRGYGLLAAVVRSEMVSCWFVKTNKTIRITSAMLDATGHYLKFHLTYFTDIFLFTFGYFSSQISTNKPVLKMGYPRGIYHQEAGARILPLGQGQASVTRALHPLCITANICLLSV